MLNLFTGLFFVTLSFPSLGTAKTILLNGTAASVGKELVTIQDVYLYRAIQRFKAGEKPAVQIEAGEKLKRTIQKTAFEHMVYLELKSFEFDGGNRTEVEKEAQSIRRKQKPEEWASILKQFQLTEGALSEKLHTTLQVERFMQKKVDTLTPIVTDQEAEKFFAENPTRFKGSSLPQMKANIQVLLKKQHIQKGLEEWIQFLKEKYGFTILLED